MARRGGLEEGGGGRGKVAGVISWIWRFNSVHPMLLFLGDDRVMMSGGKGIFGSWEKVVARCGRSWPIARQHYRVPTTDASLIVSDVSALNFQNAVVDEGPCGGGRGRVSRRHHLPSGPTNPPPPPPPQNRGIRNHSCFPVLYLSRISLAPRIPRVSWPLAFHTPRVSLHPDWEKSPVPAR